MLRPSLPQEAAHPDRRASQLSTARTSYRYAYDWPPGVATSAELPKADEYPISFALRSLPVYLDIGANLAGMALEGWSPGDVVGFLRARFEDTDHAGLAKHLLSTPRELAASAPPRRPPTWQGYEALFATWKAPEVVAAFQEETTRDDAFAWQRVGGVNPMVLARCAELPPHLPVTEARYRAVMGQADSLAAARAEGRLYLADYAALDGVAAGVTDGLQKYVAAPLALFAVEQDTGTLRPVAIQCGQSPTAPLVSPGDGWRWRMAQTLVQIADANLHEGFAHLGRTHMVMEAVGLAMHRQLAEDHPLYVLLSAHVDTTFAINHSAKTDLIAPGGTVDRCFAPQIGAFGGIVKAALDSYPLDTTDPARDLRDRGLDDRIALPHHPYRDAALPLWDALATFLGEYVALYYTSDADVAADTELAAFVAELGATDGGRLKGVPPARTVAELVWLLTRLVFIAGPQHSAVNFPQFPNMGFPPNMPGAAYTPPMDASTPDDEAAYTAMLPPWRIVIESTSMVFLLSNVRNSKLGDYGLLHFKDIRVHAVVARFQQRLEQLEADQASAQIGLPLPYPYLRPSQILQSISI